MVSLREVDRSNFDECRGLERKISLFVGDADCCLAEAYLFREYATAYAIYQDKTVVGLVIIMDRPEESDKFYSFTDLFIADDYQGKGYGKGAVQAIIEKLRHEKKRSAVEIQVHKANAIAKNIYLQSGFVKIKDSDSDNDFEVMRLAL